MGNFTRKKHEEANDALLNAVDTDSKFESLKEVLSMLSSEDGTKTFAQLVQAEITKAIGEGGSIETWADARYEAKTVQSMRVDEIIKAVRWCIDEEAMNAAGIADVSAYDFDGGTHTDEGMMNNIIKSKIGDALRWICLYAPSDLLGGTDEYVTTTSPNDTPVPTGILVDMPASGTLVPTAISGTSAGKLTMPADFVKLARIRVAGWNRSVKDLITEDSEEYLQLYDTNGATATADRPQAVLIEKSTREIEVWPTGTSVEYTYVAAVDAQEHVRGTGTEQDPYVYYYAIPPRVKTSFIYYLAFLLLSAYADGRSENMLKIAMQNLNITNKQ